jgi:hypothetical protein
VAFARHAPGGAETHDAAADDDRFHDRGHSASVRRASSRG